jgi:hypothetical protein
MWSKWFRQSLGLGPTLGFKPRKASTIYTVYTLNFYKKMNPQDVIAFEIGNCKGLNAYRQKCKARTDY